MGSRKQFNGSAADVEAAFYDALNRGDTDSLMELWAEDEDIVCIHPGGPRLSGHDAIRASWEAILERGGLQIRPSPLHVIHNVASAVPCVTIGGMTRAPMPTGPNTITPRYTRVTASARGMRLESRFTGGATATAMKAAAISQPIGCRSW